MTLSKKAKALGDEPAYPCHEMTTYPGLTKREAFAMAAMQGFCATEWGEDEPAIQIAKFSSNQADALLEALAAEAE